MKRESLICLKLKPCLPRNFRKQKNKALKGRGDLNSFKAAVVIGGCKEPNFKDAKSIELLGVKTPEEYLRKVMLTGEISRLAGEILKFSGFGEEIGA